MARKGDGPKRVIAISDLHCGARSGLTPPGHQSAYNLDSQAEAWKWYAERVRTLKKQTPIYAVLALGDLIDGRSAKDGGIESVTTDRRIQADMATECLSVWSPTKYAIVRGTGYHTHGGEEDWEDSIARALDAPIHNMMCVEIDGVKIDCKHKTGRSGIPHGRSTPLMRAKLWADILGDEDKIPGDVDLLIRGHVHYFACVGGIRKGKQWWAMSLPAMQLPQSRYGERECEGTVDYGFVVIDIYPEGRYAWHVETVALQSAKASPIQL